MLAVGDVGDAGAGGDGNATDTTQDKRGETKRSKASVMFSNDEVPPLMQKLGENLPSGKQQSQSE